MKHRMLRVKELIKRELSDAIQKELTFDGVLVTINEVDVTPDLKQGHVYVGIVGDEKKKRKALEHLKSKRGLLQRMVSKRVVLKYFPQLQFKEDDSVARGVDVISLMDEIGDVELEDLPESPEEGTVEDSNERL